MLPFQVRGITSQGQINIPKKYLTKLGAVNGSSFKVTIELSRKRILLDLIK